MDTSAGPSRQDEVAGIGAVMRSALQGSLPPRYRDFWRGPFAAELQGALVPGIQILDIGAGAQPTLEPTERPARSRYVGLDVSPHEFARAPAGSYDEIVVADVCERVVELAGRFDLIVSFQVLEHVEPLADAIENMRTYLRPGGLMVHRLSGRRSLPSMINRALPEGLARWLEVRLRGRDPDSIFPATYDRCTYSDLDTMLANFSSHTVVPQYTGAMYFHFLRPLQAAYLGYEDWTCRRDKRDLASYYVVSARR